MPSPTPPRPTGGKKPRKAAVKAASPGRPKDMSKRAAILEVAKRLFVANGFDRVSMDQIAAEAGVSKLTVYSHFGDKDSLFSAAIRAKCEGQMPETLFQAQEGPLRDRLTEIAHAFFGLVASEDALSMHRMMTIPDACDPHVRDLFWQAGPQRVKDAIAEFFTHCRDRGELDIDDFERAASQFLSLIKGDLHMRLLCWMCATPPTEADTRAHIDATVELFLRAYATRPAGRA